MEKNYQDEYNRKINISLKKQDDLIRRMEDFIAENGPHFTYLKERARARNIPVVDTDDIAYFQDINKFLTLFGLQNIVDDEDIIEQQFAVSVFNKYQTFANELRGVRRELLEHKIGMTRSTVAAFYEIIETQRENLNIQGLDMSNRLVRKEYRHLKINSDNFIADTQADIERMEAMIKLNELALASLQQEKLS